MKTIGASVSNEYYDKIEELAERRKEHKQQIIIDALDRYLIELEEMEIKRIFKPKIKMEDKK